MSKATESFNADQDALRSLTEHDNENVALAAKVVLKHRYDEEVSL